MASTGTTDSKAQVDYDTKHAYFYLPKIPTEDGEVADNIDLGAILRLGGYCDLEQQAHSVPADELHYYPQKHIDSQGAGSENIYKNAAGSDTSSSHGILMACDGHFLLKAGEKMNVETGDHHLQVNGDYEHDTTGSVKVQSGNTLDIKSGNGKTMTLNAGDQTGDMLFQTNNKTEDVTGTSTTTVGGNLSSTNKGNKFEFTQLFDTKIVKQISYSGFIGGQIVTASWGFQAFGLVIKIYVPGQIMFSALQISGIGKRFFSTALSVKVEGILMENNAARVRTAVTQMDAVELHAGAIPVAANAHQIHTFTEAVRANVGAMDAQVKELTVFV